MVDQCVSDFMIKWNSADYDPTCGELSYTVNVTDMPPESYSNNTNVTNKTISFTNLNSNTAYIVTVQAISMGRGGNIVTKYVHTVNSTSAQPSSKSLC